MKARVLVIDDEPQILDLMSNIFSDRYDVLLASDGTQGLALASEQSPDLVLLDVRMPGISGFTVCERLQSLEATRGIPIIMLTAVKETEDRVRAFRSGADDFVGKPFSVEELIARVESKIRKRATRSEPGTSIRCGNLVLNIQAFQACIGSSPAEEIRLSMLEFNLLRHFVENREILLSRENIIEAVWKDRGVAPRALDWHILSLRKKLGRFDHKISTVYGGGYILKPKEANESR